MDNVTRYFFDYIFINLLFSYVVYECVVYFSFLSLCFLNITYYSLPLYIYILLFNWMWCVLLNGNVNTPFFFPKHNAGYLSEHTKWISKCFSLTLCKFYLCPLHTYLSAQQQSSTCQENRQRERRDQIAYTRTHTHLDFQVPRIVWGVCTGSKRKREPLCSTLISLSLPPYPCARARHRQWVSQTPDPVGGPSEWVYLCVSVFFCVCDAANAISGKFAHAAFAPMKKSPQNGTRDSTPLGWQFTRTSSWGQNTRAF